MEQNKVLLVFLLLPFASLAHGEEIFILIGLELLVIVAFTLFITLVKMPIKRKLILILVFIITEIILYFLTNKIPYMRNKEIISTITAIVPITTVLGTYLLLFSNNARNSSV